jgi:hypothetical protein
MKAMNACEVYYGDVGILVVSQVETDIGWLLSVEPVRKLSRSASPEEVGNAVGTALESFHTIPHPRNVEDVGGDVLGAAGVSSWPELASGGGLLNVEVTAEVEVQITPTEMDDNGGFSPVAARSRRCPLQEKALGQAILELIASREPKE